MENSLIDFSIFRSFLDRILSVLPNVLGAIGMMLAGIILAKFIRKVSSMLWTKIKIDRLGDKLNEIDIVAKSHFKIKLSAILSEILYYSILVIFMMSAADILNMPTISNFLKSIVEYLPKVISAFLFLVVGVMFCDFIRKIVETTLKSLGISSAKIVASAIFYFAFLNIFISALAQAGIETSFIESNITLLIGGVVVAFAIGYGLASKDALSNFIASYYNQTIKEGDIIAIGGLKGEVISKDKSNLVLKDGEIIHYVPLHKIIKENITFFKKT